MLDTSERYNMAPSPDMAITPAVRQNTGVKSLRGQYIKRAPCWDVLPIVYFSSNESMTHSVNTTSTASWLSRY